MATAIPKTKHPTVERAKPSRKRSHHENNTTIEKEDPKVQKNKDGFEPTANKRRRKKQKKLDGPKKTKKSLAGMTLSVSTLSDNTKSSTSSQNSSSYNEVCGTCRGLGANVVDLVCKRVNLVVCSEAAVKQATQRVRKAIKKNKPLVSVAWLDKCHAESRRVDYEEYRLDEKARESIKNREDRLQSVSQEAVTSEETTEVLPDAGWTEPQDLGCCCVCHENGTTATCPWCKDAPCAKLVL